jgi:hypothetical protein
MQRGLQAENREQREIRSGLRISPDVFGRDLEYCERGGLSDIAAYLS